MFHLITPCRFVGVKRYYVTHAINLCYLFATAMYTVKFFTRIHKFKDHNNNCFFVVLLAGRRSMNE